MDHQDIKWKWYDFSQLSIDMLYSLLKLRQDVFIVEQKSPYEDLDSMDQDAKRLIGTINNEMAAYLRLLPVDLCEKGYISFGRFVVKKSYRGFKLGHILMKNLFAYLEQNQIKSLIKISAQYYLVKFYSQYGFVTSGEFYIEDSIKHIAMIREHHETHIRNE